jgi:hypothetical protein
MKKILFIFLSVVSFFLFYAMSACFAKDEDPCKDQGIIVKNLSFKEIWYKPQGGNCIVLKRHNTFTIKPAEEISLFSDIVCKTPYCPASKYTDYKSYDVNGDCSVRILPHNTLSDM